MIKQLKPELWKEVEQMEPHTEARKKNEKLWKMNEELAVNKIQKTFGLSFLKKEEIHFSCGVLEVGYLTANMFFGYTGKFILTRLFFNRLTPSK